MIIVIICELGAVELQLTLVIPKIRGKLSLLVRKFETWTKTALYDFNRITLLYSQKSIY